MASEKIEVALVTTEIVPYSKVGGLADVMGSLPDELEKLGADITVFTPLYDSIDRGRYMIEKVGGLDGLCVTVAGKAHQFSIYSGTKPGTDIDVYFLENEHFYGRENIYTTADGEGFEDEDERTIFFNLAVIEALKTLKMSPDVIHCNDFHSGLIPVYIAGEKQTDSRFRNTGTVFSIHNLAYQGLFEPDFLEKAGFDPEIFQPMSPFEFWGRVNVMKMALMFTGMISTVSRTYAEEITTTDEYGYGLEGVLRYRSRDLVGILNGIDPVAWDPATDELIPANFTRKDLSGKKENKAALLGEFGLPAGDEPLIGIVSRLVDQKGFDILYEALEKLLDMEMKIVILGTGQQKYHESYTELAGRFPDRLGVRLEFNNRLAHLIEAGSDYFLMPSKYEPCGLNQMYSFRYGTMPVVRATGGLKDTVKDLDTRGSRGNGFTFEPYTAKALIEALKKAIEFFADGKAVEKTRKRIMAEDHSWKASANEYLEMYGRAKGRIGMRLTTP
jgi:starch synthase